MTQSRCECPFFSNSGIFTHQVSGAGTVRRRLVDKVSQVVLSEVDVLILRPTWPTAEIFRISDSGVVRLTIPYIFPAPIPYVHA
jgi:hypothetical protein